MNLYKARTKQRHDQRYPTFLHKQNTLYELTVNSPIEIKPYLTVDADAGVWSNWQTLGCFRSAPATDGAQGDFFASGTNSERSCSATKSCPLSTAAAESSAWLLEFSSVLAAIFIFFLINTGPRREPEPFNICRWPLLRTPVLAAVFLASTLTHFSKDRRYLPRTRCR